jgi:nucleoid-associated protein YgaU
MEKQLKKFLKGLKLNENTISTVLGAVVLVVIGALIFNYFNTNRPPQISDDGLSTSPTPVASQNQKPEDVKLVEESGKMVPEGLPASYTVQKGDHLWSIAEKFYKSGYNFIDIAKANNLKNASIVEVGQTLTIPKVAARPQTYKETVKTAAIDGNSYTVAKGDSLWSISLRAYGDGFAWTRVYQANKAVIGKNPGVIEVGMVLTLTR